MRVRIRLRHAVAGLLPLLAVTVSAATFYVDINSSNPMAPYADWSTAATNIQDAIDAAGSGDEVLVTNGIFAVGGKVMAGDLTNRVALDKSLTVRSMNGPLLTIIEGAGAVNGPGAVRCAWLTNNATLIGFTLQAGATRTVGDLSMQSGGAVFCTSSNATVANCLIAYNSSSAYGSGAYQGTLLNSALTGNRSYTFPGATFGATLINCAITYNTNYGVVNSHLTNCIVASNTPANFSSSTLAYCCTSPRPPGAGNLGVNPLLLEDGIHVDAASPCRGAGTNVVTGTDIDGQAWSNPPSMGCDEWNPEPAMILEPTAQARPDGPGFVISAKAAGQPPFACWWTKNGTLIENGGHYAAANTSTLTVSGILASDAGNYQVIVSNEFGVVTSGVKSVVIHCVNAEGTSPSAPFLSWSSAATNIQDAIDAASPGEIVLATNGVYGTGGKVMETDLTNRVALDKPLIVESVNGPATTVIEGAWDPTSTNGPLSVRCAWLTNGAALSGFTLQDGATRGPADPSYSQRSGGGAWGASTNAILVNCTLIHNIAAASGGGVYQAAVNNSTLLSNQAVGSPSNPSIGSGGGAYACTLRNCVVSRNSASNQGGGAAHSSLMNCAVTKNSAVMFGGGAYFGTLVNCTVSGNAAGGYGSQSGAVAYASLTNCIVYGNTVISPGAYINFYNCNFAYSDTDPLPTGTSNIDIDPQLLADGVHLSESSPCRGAGTSVGVGSVDIDGQAWSDPPAIGCDEWQPAPVIAFQPSFQAAPGLLTLSSLAAGQEPFAFFWRKNGSTIENGEHYRVSGTGVLEVNAFGPDDAGTYDFVVSNAFGTVTSEVTQVIIHCADAAGANPSAPYSTWATAATNIQDAIDAALPGEIVLVTDGFYATGGKVMAGDLLNRVALDKALWVVSVNGYASTVIEGAWDPTSTNGSLAVRCAWLTNGAVLSGFTLRHGATRSFSGFIGADAESGGAAWCASTNGVVADCLLMDNAAACGGGMAYGTLENCYVGGNQATYGAGAFLATLNNCTVTGNNTTTSLSNSGAGTYAGITRNSVVVRNYSSFFMEDNYSLPQTEYSYCCTRPAALGVGNINADPAFLDGFHIASTSPCVGAGSPLYASGTDLDGEPWANPPSMGCDEVVLSNLVGPLSVGLYAYQTNLLVNKYGIFSGFLTGRVSYVEWSFGDGPTVTNSGAGITHRWSNIGDYTVTFAAFNTDHPEGISTNLTIHVLPLESPLLQSVTTGTNGFQFQFAGQQGAVYYVQVATNLTPPVAWHTLQTVYANADATVYVSDAVGTDAARFYRVQAQ